VFMKQFFSTLFRWIGQLRNFLINGIFIVFLLLFVAAIFSTQPEVPESAALIIDPHGQIVEELELPAPGSLPFDFSFSAPNQTNLHDLVEVILHAANDERIRVLVLKL